jgi:hypothetical protein
MEYWKPEHWIKHVPSCWPPRLAGAPVTDYSVLDTWRPRLRVDCSTLHIVRPALAADLTRWPTLSALRRPRIAPPSAQYARAAHGSLRATDFSVVSTWNSAPRTDCSVPRHLMRLASSGLLQSPRLASRIACGLLRSRYLAFHDGLRIAPYSDTSRPRAVHGSLRVRHLSPAPDRNCFLFDA